MSELLSHQWMALVTLAAAVCGCGGASKPAPVPTTPASVSLLVHVNTTTATNQGNSFYTLVRAVDAKTAPAAESYAEVSALAFATPPDASVLDSEPIVPGAPASFTVDVTASKAVNVYFLLTNPGVNWRVALRPPFPHVLTVDLDQNQVKNVQKN